MTAPTTSPADSLADLILACHNARGGLHEFSSRLAAARERFADQYAELIALHEQSRALVEKLERQIRIRAVEVYETTGSKSPAPGVGIRMEKVVSYDHETAFAWAKERGLALELNQTAFEKIALAGESIPGVKVAEQPKATIARDLTEAAALVAFD